MESEIEELRRSNEAMRAWIMGDCHCPCCGMEDECVADCTFSADCPEERERMESARHVLRDQNV